MSAHIIFNDTYATGLLKRDSPTITAIYSQLFPLISQFVIRTGGSKEDARDVFQEGLSRIYQKLQRKDIPTTVNFGGFLYTVCKYIWLKRIRKYKPHISLSDEHFSDIANESSFDEINREWKYLFDEKYYQLPLQSRQVLNLYLEGHSMKEIASIMGYKSAAYAKKKKYLIQKRLIAIIQSDSRYEELSLK